MNRSLQFLLDTDMCIYLLNGDVRVKDGVAAVGVEAIAVSVLTVGELYFGAYNSSRVEANVTRIRTFLAAPGPCVLPIDNTAAESFGRFKAALRRTGQPIGDLDLLIAGVAVSHGLKIVTNNTAHFERIAGVSVENWLYPDGSAG